ncbi:MAG: Signal recognition particle receptor FtsY [Lentisphaerae bacterium ADurb.BinA184]|nr:MAG: Signal recognition particle receptor FtsY [Lentisphaerae bacterium ADurb.BinA184]
MKSLFTIFKHGLQKTKTSLVRHVRSIFGETTQWTDESFDSLEAALLAADLGVDASTRLTEDVRSRYRRGLISTTDDILAVAREDIAAALRRGPGPDGLLKPDGLTVIVLVGVNGSGKTTTAAKLAHQWKQDGRHVMLAACDTFRAAAIEQLTIWAERVGCPIVAGKHGSDAAAVAFDAVAAARRRNCDVLIVDTAGRQHTRHGLMEELGKVRRTLAKAQEGAPHHVWLTVDASSGTNALLQAREFGRVCDLTGLILTKLDGSGKGGVVVPICRELAYPVLFVGLGEGLDDLQPFDPEMFARAVFEA